MISGLIALAQDELRRIWIYRWLAGIVSVAVFAAAAAYVARIADVYDAWGQLYVNKQTTLAAAAQGTSAVGDAFGSPYVVQKTLLNDENLERILRKVDPASSVLGASEMSLRVAALRRTIHLAPDPGEGFVEFHVLGDDPVRARSVAQALLTQYVSSNADRSRRDLAGAATFLDDQIAALDMDAAESGARLDGLRRSHAGLTAASPTTVAQEPAAEVAALDPVPALTVPPAPAPPSATAERVAGLQAKLTSLRTVYTDRYPDVVSVKRQLAEATADLQAEPHAPTPSVLANGGVSVPRRSVWRPRVRRAPVVAPAVAAEWADALRSDQALRLRRQQLVERRDATRMAQAVYGEDGSGKFEITRAPVTPLVPIGPNRVLYLALAALGAAGAGLGAAYGRAAMRGVLVSPREVQSAFQLPVVGTVSWRSKWARRSPGPERSPAVRKTPPRRSVAAVFPFRGAETGRASS